VQAGVARENLLHTAFLPEQNPDDPGIAWKPLATGGNPAQPWLLDLAKAIGGEDRAGYLTTFVFSPRQRRARLELGSDDSLKVWLNGRRIHANPVWRGVAPGDDVVPITLQEGWNHLLLKVVQGAADWGACARLVTPEGTRLDGTRVSAELNAEQRQHLAPEPLPETVLSWSMDEADGEALADGSGHGIVGVLRGEPVRAAGIKGRCLVFDGVDDQVRADAPQLPVEAGAAWSINLYVFLENDMPDLTIIGGFGDVVAADPKGCQRYFTRLRDAIHFWGSNIDVNTGKPYDVGRWQMLTVTFDGTTVRVYRDGAELVHSDETLALAAGAVYLAPIDHWGNGNRFAGRIDEFTIWDGSLTQEQIDTLAAALPQASPSGQ